MVQQTAVEWLIESIKNKSEIVFKHIDEDGFFKQAKQMEKEQIIKAHNNAVVSPYTDLYVWETNGKIQITKGEQYYNETYGKSI